MSNAKLNAAKSALAATPDSGAMGLGSGSTVAVFARELANKIAAEDLPISVVPTSYQAYQLAIEYRIPITNLDIHPELSLTVDGADEIDRSMNLTKGGGGALFQEKIVASASRRLIIVADDSKLVDTLGTKSPIPIEVLPFALGVVKRKLSEMGVKPTLREAQGKLGPVVTDNGNFLLDLKFSRPIDDPAETAFRLKMIPGVVETGLFIDMASEVHVGTDKGAYVLKRN
jgi:ribose 5-phosphate isomerase A